jgi:hypothetical protein
VVVFNDFMAFVNERDFEAATKGDEAARQRIAAALEGVDLYFHACPSREDEIGVTLADLICHKIIARVTLHST